MCKIDKKTKMISTPAIEKIQEKHLKKIPKYCIIIVVSLF